MKPLFALALSLAACFQHAFSEERSVAGRVVDREGKPIVSASVAPFWRANGSVRKSDGTPYDLSDPAQCREFWGQLGQMEPFVNELTTTKEDGSFSIALDTRDRALFAMDSERVRGCIVEIPEAIDAKDGLVLQVGPLVTVKGALRSQVESKAVGWSHVYVELPANGRKPISINRLVSCGSFDGQFEFRLPPGEYQLEAYACSDLVTGKNDLWVHPAPEFAVRESDADLDVGILELTLAPPDASDLRNESKKEGRWKDYTEHYGEPAPHWHAVDGRGIDLEKNIEGLRGKWVLLDFWGLDCPSCLAKGIPKMMEFYEKNADFRSRFEVVGICVDYTGKIDDMAKLDRAMTSIESHVWGGKKIPFPIVLDNSFTTWERYGVPGLGTVVLVDPAGRIVEGDETTLQRVLDGAE